jgi:hypothetical protein
MDIPMIFDAELWTDQKKKRERTLFLLSLALELMSLI